MPVADKADALSALAPLLRVRPELQSLCRFEAPWASPHKREAQGWAPFHMVTAGTCVLDVGGALHPLAAGDLVLLPHGDPHVVRAATAGDGRHAAPVRVEMTSVIAIKSNSDHPDVELICGRLAFEQPHDNLVRIALPQVIRVSTADGAAVARLHALLIAIRDELDGAGPGARSITCDLASALLVMMLRVHFQREAASDGILALLGHRQTARAIVAMMEAPARAWTLDALAAAAGVSRATLVREFRRLAKATPFEVLAEVRLGLARQALAATEQPLADIAYEAGYASQAAFSRAFKRRFDCSPSAWRGGPSPGSWGGASASTDI